MGRPSPLAEEEVRRYRRGGPHIWQEAATGFPKLPEKAIDETQTVTQPRGFAHLSPLACDQPVGDPRTRAHEGGTKLVQRDLADS